MVNVPFQRGEVLFREGEVGDFVCLIVDGEVEVIKELGDRRVVLGTVKAGEFVGEMGVLEGHPRSASVRALSDGHVELISRGAFLKRVAEDGETALKLLLRLSERLRATGQRYAAAAVSLAGQDLESEAPSEAEVEELQEEALDFDISLFASGAATDTAIGETGLTIEDFPFVVGRKVETAAGPSPRIHLLLDDKRPYRLSRIHFAIERAATGSLFVRDLGSTLGTQVNQEFLGADAPRDRLALSLGDNIIVAGGEDSPFAFRAVVSESKG